jgi:7-cyano-7-deazaguanine synthase in queuosine biosynthesis
MDNKFYMPWANTNKKGIAEMYRDENLIDSLVPVTRSCEWDPKCEYYDVIGTVDPGLGHCGECWWCKEREWGFDQVVPYHGNW